MRAEVLPAVSDGMVRTVVFSIINNNRGIIRCRPPSRGHHGVGLSILLHLCILPAICRSGVTPLGGARAALHYQPVEIGASPRQDLFGR